MSDEIIARIARSTRYRDVDPALVARLVAEERPRGGSADAVAKRVKRRLHQAIGAFRGSAVTERVLGPIRAAWKGDMAGPAFREACRDVLATHASTRERVPQLDRFFHPIWELTSGAPGRLLDLGCGIGPLMLPWMALAHDAMYVAADADQRALAVVGEFMRMVGQPHELVVVDLVAHPLRPLPRADVALLLKLVPTLGRQDPKVATRLLSSLPARFAVVSFPSRSLGRRAKGMERTYRAVIDSLGSELGLRSAEASVPGELVFVLELGRG